ncbi:MAG: small multi-drug export protein [Methanobacteriota archaeon]
MANPWLYLIFITLVPGIELRGAIPYGIFEGSLNPVNVFVVAVLTNILVIYPAFIFLDIVFDIAMRVPLVKRYIKKTQRKAKPYVDKYGVIGLAFFVAIPLPGTGAYSGALAAHLFGMKNKKAFIAISFGVLTAGILVFLISTIFHESLGWLLGP